MNPHDEHVYRKLYCNRLQDQRIYEQCRQMYLNTDSDIIRHVAEGAMIQLLKRGVQPCHKS